MDCKIFLKLSKTQHLKLHLCSTVNLFLIAPLCICVGGQGDMCAYILTEQRWSDQRPAMIKWFFWISELAFDCHQHKKYLYVKNNINNKLQFILHRIMFI